MWSISLARRSFSLNCKRECFYSRRIEPQNEAKYSVFLISIPVLPRLNSSYGYVKCHCRAFNCHSSVVAGGLLIMLRLIYNSPWQKTFPRNYSSRHGLNYSFKEMIRNSRAPLHYQFNKIPLIRFFFAFFTGSPETLFRLRVSSNIICNLQWFVLPPLLVSSTVPVMLRF